MTLPSNMNEEAFSLEPSAEVFLYEIELTNNSTIYLSPKREYVWQTNLYEEVPCHMSQIRRQADGEVSRPKFSVVNPGHLFTAAVHEGTLEGATITRVRILQSDLLADNNLALRQSFRISRMVTVNKNMIMAECRTPLDGANFKVPARTFHPPEFPHVSLR